MNILSAMMQQIINPTTHVGFFLSLHKSKPQTQSLIDATAAMANKRQIL